MISEFKVENEIVAVLLDASDIESGVYPISDESSALQVLMMKRVAGYKISKHIHKKIERTVFQRQKALVVVKGSMEVTLCDHAGKECDSITVRVGQCLYVKNGGYAITIKDDCTFFEFKNGPHIEDKILL